MQRNKANGLSPNPYSFRANSSKIQGRYLSRRKSQGRKRPSTRFTADGNADRTRDFSDFGMNVKRGHISRIGVNLCDCNRRKRRKLRKIIGGKIGAATRKEYKMSNNNKIKFPLWIHPKAMETVKQMYKDDNCRSQSEFIEKAVNAYVGYLRANDSSGMLPNYMISTLKAIVADSDNKQNRVLFKLAVEMAMMMNILAAHCEIDEKDLSQLRNSCIDEVRRINGMLKFEDAYHWQND